MSMTERIHMVGGTALSMEGGDFKKCLISEMLPGRFIRESTG